MDNFGIFKLLGSLYDFLGKTKSPPTPDARSDFNTGFTAQPPVKGNENIPPATVRATLPPIQNPMLSVMSNHDQTVNRILRKNGK